MSCYCPICAELSAESGTRLSMAVGDQEVRNAVLRDSPSFALIPSVGPLALGHSLLVTKAHQSTVFGGLTAADYDQVQALFAVFSAKIVDRINPSLEILCFEHGAARSFPDRELCSTVHAHLHLVPLADHLVARITKSVRGESLDSLSPLTLSSTIESLTEYLLVFRLSRRGEINGATIQDASELAPQFMRRLVADHIGNKNWNWKTHSDAFLLRQTIHLGFEVNASCILLSPASSMR
jgi:hypothetical protein